MTQAEPYTWTINTDGLRFNGGPFIWGPTTGLTHLDLNGITVDYGTLFMSEERESEEDPCDAEELDSFLSGFNIIEESE